MSNERLQALRLELNKRQIQAFLVPRCDEYQNEYVPAAAERLAWLSGFTGSAGMAAIATNRAALFVDGRYTLQAVQQVDTESMEQQPLGAEDIADWLCQALIPGDVVGYDPSLHTEAGLAPIIGKLNEHNIQLRAQAHNPIDTIWEDQPPKPCGSALPHDESFTGEASSSKRQRITKLLAQRNQDALLLANPEVCAWLLNIRGNDIPHLPVALTMGLLYRDGSVTLYLAEQASSPKLQQHLGNEVTLVHQVQEIFIAAQQKQCTRVWADPLLANCWTLQHLRAMDVELLLERDPVTAIKACKNPVELAGSRTAHIRDGVALCEFLAELPQAIQQDDFGELQAVQLLRGKREQQQGFCDDSFESISGYCGNGAIVHYRVTPESSLPMHARGIYLIDSGGQYPEGTTDVTRTVALGDFPKSAKEHFTRVLKGHISIATLRFPIGTCGEQIDAFARRALWDLGLDYAHGTGHGVGSFLSVHEGPQRIGKASTKVPLQAGMIVSNEPGFYRTGEYGIRIENLIFIKESREYAGFLEFETLTLAPIDHQLIDPDLLTSAELHWLNNYHRRVRETLTPLVSQQTAAWLNAATQPLEQ